jgi:hypothetical protein
VASLAHSTSAPTAAKASAARAKKRGWERLAEQASRSTSLPWSWPKNGPVSTPKNVTFFGDNRINHAKHYTIELGTIFWFSMETIEDKLKITKTHDKQCL